MCFETKWVVLILGHNMFFMENEEMSRNSSKEIGNNQELIQSDLISRPKKQKGKKHLHKLYKVHRFEKSCSFSYNN